MQLYVKRLNLYSKLSRILNAIKEHLDLNQHTIDRVVAPSGGEITGIAIEGDGSEKIWHVLLSGLIQLQFLTEKEGDQLFSTCNSQNEMIIVNLVQLAERLGHQRIKQLIEKGDIEDLKWEYVFSAVGDSKYQCEMADEVTANAACEKITQVLGLETPNSVVTVMPDEDLHYQLSIDLQALAEWGKLFNTDDASLAAFSKTLGERERGDDYNNNNESSDEEENIRKCCNVM